MKAMLLLALVPVLSWAVNGDFIEVRRLAPGVRFDLKYATPDNFTHKTVYPSARCFLRREVAEKLARVQAALHNEGLGLKLWDCYRPFSVQEKFWAIVPNEDYVARPVRDAAGKPTAGSRHNRGAAVDLTLVDAKGRELEMPTGFDDFTPKAHRDSKDMTTTARRDLGTLEAAMAREGFKGLPTEWWHYDAEGWEKYELADFPMNSSDRPKHK